MKASQEVRVGAVVILALILATGGFFFLKGIRPGSGMYYLSLQDNAVVNINEGAEVRLNGVKIGNVQSVALDKQQRPQIIIAVGKEYQLRHQYKYSVSSASLLGDNYVDIRHSGVSATSDGIYQPNNSSQKIPLTVSGFASLSQQAPELIGGVREVLDETKSKAEQMTNQANKLMEKIDKGILSDENQRNIAIALRGLAQLSQQSQKAFNNEGVRFTLGDEKARVALRETLNNSAATAAALRQTVQLADSLMRENRQRTKAIFVNLEKMSSEAAGVSESLRFILNNSGLKENAPKTFDSLRAAADNIRDATQSLKALGNEQTKQDLRVTIDSLRQSSESIRDSTSAIKKVLADPETQQQLQGTVASLYRITQSLEKTTGNIGEASGGLKNILGDQQMQNDIKASAAELRATMESANAAVSRINALLGGKKKKPEREIEGEDGKPAKDKPRQSSRPNGVDFTYRYLDRDRPLHRHAGDLTLNAELFGDPWRVGISDIGEGNKFTLQGGRFFGDGALRAGLYRSKLGVGADYYWRNFFLEGNLWNPNDTSWNAYAGLRLTPNFDLMIGKEHDRDMRSTVFGVRLRP